MNLEPAPRLNKTPFIAVAAVCFLAVVLIGLFAEQKFAPYIFLTAFALLIISIVAVMIPILVDYAADSAEYVQQEREKVAEQAQRLHAAGESLMRAAAQIKAVEEAAAKTAHAAENLPYRMQEKLAEFTQQLAQTEDDEKERLTDELATLRQSESERLQTIADKIHKASADWAALEVATRKQLTTAQETSATKFDTRVQTLTESLEGKVSAASSALDVKVDTVVTTLDARMQTVMAALDAKLATFAAAIAAANLPPPPPVATPAVAPAPVEATPTPAPKRPRAEKKRPEPTPEIEPAPELPAAVTVTPESTVEAEPAVEIAPVAEAVSEPVSEPTPVVESALAPNLAPVESTPVAPVEETPAAATPVEVEPSAELAPVELTPSAAPAAKTEATELALEPTEPAVATESAPEPELTAPAPVVAEEIPEPAEPSASSEPAAAAPAVEFAAIDAAPEPTPPPGESPAPETSVPETAAAESSAPVAPDDFFDDEPISQVATARSNEGDSEELFAESVEKIEPAASSDGATRLLATAYIGIGNKLFIRGDAPGLSWEKGVAMQFVSIGKWGWASHEITAPFRAKLYKNDDLPALSGEVTLIPGKHVEATALF